MRLSKHILTPKTFCAGLLLLSTLWPALALGQERLTLDRIEFVGQKRLSISQLTSLSELKIGQVVDQGSFDAAAGKLLQSGLLRKLSYRVRSAKGRATVTFNSKKRRLTCPSSLKTLSGLAKRNCSQPFARTYLSLAAPRRLPARRWTR